MHRLLLIALMFVSPGVFACCAGDNRSLTERLISDNRGTIFTCRILTFTPPPPPPANGVAVRYSMGGPASTATAEVVRVYFGRVDTAVVTVGTGLRMKVGATYLLYSEQAGREFSCGGGCDHWSKEVTTLTSDELNILASFAGIIEHTRSGKFTFSHGEQKVLAEGRFRKGKAVGVWKHYTWNGTLKSIHDFAKGSDSQFEANGFIASRITTNSTRTLYETYSRSVNGQLALRLEEVYSEPGCLSQRAEYHENGLLKISYCDELVGSDRGHLTWVGKTGPFKEYHENGQLKTEGEYLRDTRIGTWREYNENGTLASETDHGGRVR